MILGLSGKMGVGKTALADYLVKSKGVTKVSFATPLKEFADLMFPGISKAVKNQPFSKYEWTPREFFINLGAFLRYHYQDYWLERGLAQIKDPRKVYVFDDVRYVNEADAIRKLGGKIVRINRYEKENPYGNGLDVESETQLDNYSFDAIIQDCENTTMARLRNAGDNVFREYC